MYFQQYTQNSLLFPFQQWLRGLAKYYTVTNLHNISCVLFVLMLVILDKILLGVHFGRNGCEDVESRDTEKIYVM